MKNGDVPWLCKRLSEGKVLPTHTYMILHYIALHNTIHYRQHTYMFTIFLFQPTPVPKTTSPTPPFSRGEWHHGFGAELLCPGRHRRCRGRRRRGAAAAEGHDSVVAEAPRAASAAPGERGDLGESRQSGQGVAQSGPGKDDVRQPYGGATYIYHATYQYYSGYTITICLLL